MHRTAEGASRGRWEHLPEYLIEAGALGTFMMSACLFGTLLGHPASPVVGIIASDDVRRGLMGLAMGLTAIAIIHSPWGRRSGAQMNPAVTLTFYRLGKSASRDAAGYVAAQFIGGAAGVGLASAVLGSALAAPGVMYVVTEPGMAGIAAAFVVELTISAIMMTMVLHTTSSERWKRYTGVIAGLLVAVFIILAAPVSGMSMNPARTAASAIVANHWMSAWVYFAAPFAGMLLAAEVFVRQRGREAAPCGKIMHAEPCIFCEYQSAHGMNGAGHEQRTALTAHSTSGALHQRRRAQRATSANSG